MSPTVKNLIDKYSKLQSIKESEEIQFKLDGANTELEPEEIKVLAALNMGVVTEKVMKARRKARNAC